MKPRASCVAWGSVVEEGANEGADRAQRLLSTIAQLLGVDPSFFLAQAPTGTAATDCAELLRSFQAIGDADVRRSILAMLKDLEAESKSGTAS